MPDTRDLTPLEQRCREAACEITSRWDVHEYGIRRKGFPVESEIAAVIAAQFGGLTPLERELLEACRYAVDNIDSGAVLRILQEAIARAEALSREEPGGTP